MSEEIFNERLLDKKIEDAVERVLSQRQANTLPSVVQREALDETTIERIKQFNLVSNI